MSIGELKEQVTAATTCICYHCTAILALAALWADAEARARELQHIAECEYGKCPLRRDGYSWLAEVLKEIGWPNE
jgi:hypothetical protein